MPKISTKTAEDPAESRPTEVSQDIDCEGGDALARSDSRYEPVIGTAVRC